MASVLLGTAYLPPISYMAILLQKGSADIEVCDNFQKQSYRNRCVIAGANGLQNLVVPVQKPAELMRDVRISYAENWQQVHIKSLESAYRNCPFYDVLAEDLFAELRKQHTFLIDLNFALLHLILHWLQASDTTIKPTEQFIPIEQNAMDFREAIHPKSKSLIGAAPEYYQQFASRNGFQPDLSVVDLVFHEGSLAWDYLVGLDLGDRLT